MLVSLCMLTFIPTILQLRPNVHSRLLHRYCCYRLGLFALRSLKNSASRTVSSLFCIMASLPNQCLAYSTFSRLCYLSTASLPVDQMFLHSAPAYQTDRLVYGASPNQKLTFRRPQCNDYDGWYHADTFIKQSILCFFFSKTYAYSKSFIVEKSVVFLVLFVKDIVAISRGQAKVSSSASNKKETGGSEMKWNSC